MGIQRSNLNDEKIKELLNFQYNIEVTRIEAIDRGMANIFKIYSKRTNFLLKEFSKNKTMETIEKEINIINFLKSKEINVPEYVLTKDDKYYIENEDRIIIVQKFIEGYTMENNTGDYNKVIESAEILGKVTKALLDYPKMSDVKVISKEGFIKKVQTMKDILNSLNDNNKFKERFKNDLDFKIKLSKKIIDEFDFDILKKLTILNAHGDFSVQQLIYNDDKETTVIDFETAKRVPIVWEIMRSYSFIDKEAKNGELNIDTLIEYFNHFSKYIKLNQYDLKYATELYFGNLATSPFGYEECNVDPTQTVLLNFAFFRTNLCRYLYKNNDLITKRLLKEVEHKI